jgi:transmembrane sensor
MRRVLIKRVPRYGIAQLMTKPNPNLEETSGALLDEAADWLVRLNESTASEADFAAWHLWLGADERHARAFQELERTWRLSAQAAVAWPSAGELARDRYQLEEPVDAWVSRLGRQRRRRWAALAASIALAVTLLGTWWAYSPTVIQTAIGEQRVVRLPDGSRATVGPRSRVTYRFTRAARSLVVVDGEVYFEVQKAPERPFIVQTPRGRIVDLGTAFTVDVTSDQLDVTVSEGTVRITAAVVPNASSNPVVPAVLDVPAGRRYVATDQGTRVATLPPFARLASWRDGRLTYFDEPLSAVVADLNRYSAHRIDVADAPARALHYTGTVFPEDVGDWLMSLPAAFPVRIVNINHGWRIESSTARPGEPTTAP